MVQVLAKKHLKETAVFKIHITHEKVLIKKTRGKVWSRNLRKAFGLLGVVLG